MITRGFGTVAQGMQALIDFEDVTAHNLANVSTAGFKRTNIAFQDIMQSKGQAKNVQGKYRDVGTLSNGARTERTYIDFSQGGLSESGNKLDVAIQGDGFYKIRYQGIPEDVAYDESHYYYQRTGNFVLTNDNYLVNDTLIPFKSQVSNITKNHHLYCLNNPNYLSVFNKLYSVLLPGNSNMIYV